MKSTMIGCETLTSPIGLAERRFYEVTPHIMVCAQEVILDKSRWSLGNSFLYSGEDLDLKDENFCWHGLRNKNLWCGNEHTLESYQSLDASYSVCQQIFLSNLHFLYRSVLEQVFCYQPFYLHFHSSSSVSWKVWSLLQLNLMRRFIRNQFHGWRKSLIKLINQNGVNHRREV